MRLSELTSAVVFFLVRIDAKHKSNAAMLAQCTAHLMRPVDVARTVGA